MLCHRHNAVCPKELRQILVIVKCIRDQVKIILTEHQRNRFNFPLDGFPIHFVVSNGDRSLFINDLYQFPQRIDQRIAVRLDFVIMVNFLAYQLVKFFPILCCGKPFQLGNQPQHVFLGQTTAAQHYLYQCK